MAVLEKIRVKFGILISVVIALALLSFISIVSERLTEILCHIRILIMS